MLFAMSHIYRGKLELGKKYLLKKLFSGGGGAGPAAHDPPALKMLVVFCARSPEIVQASFDLCWSFILPNKVQRDRSRCAEKPRKNC